MTIADLATFGMWFTIGAVALIRPATGLALALLLGRHTFPSRSNPIVMAAPFVVGLCILGFLLRGRSRIARESHPLLAAVGITILAGATPLLFQIGDGVAYGSQKALLLTTVTLPIVLMLLWLRSWVQVRECLRGLLIGAGALALLAMVAPAAGADLERATALGGGPIVLGQLASTSILLLVIGYRDLLPRRIVRSVWRFPVLVATLTLFGVALIRTQARFPTIALAVVLVGPTLVRRFRGVTRSRGAGQSHSRGVNSGLILVGIAALLFVATSSIRFQLLLVDPNTELARSRSDVWSLGVMEVARAFPLGDGFGSFVGVARSHYLDLEYPHNMELELASEAGVLPALFLAVVLRRIWMARPRRPDSTYSLIAGDLCLYSLLMVQVSGDLYNSRYVVAYFALLVTCTRLETRQKPTGASLTCTDKRIGSW